VKEHGAFKNYHCVFTVIGKIIQFFWCLIWLQTAYMPQASGWLVQKSDLEKTRDGAWLIWFTLQVML